MDRIVGIMQTVQQWGLDVNHDELVNHVHGLQQFVVQHALQREHPGEFSGWYSSDSAWWNGGYPCPYCASTVKLPPGCPWTTCNCGVQYKAIGEAGDYTIEERPDPDRAGGGEGG